MINRSTIKSAQIIKFVFSKLPKTEENLIEDYLFEHDTDALVMDQLMNFCIKKHIKLTGLAEIFNHHKVSNLEDLALKIDIITNAKTKGNLNLGFKPKGFNILSPLYLIVGGLIKNQVFKSYAMPLVCALIIFGSWSLINNPNSGERTGIQDYATYEVKYSGGIPAEAKQD